MKIKIEAVIDVSDFVNGLSDDEEWEWFFDILNDKRNIRLILHSNDIGDSIAETNEFKYKIIK